MIEHHLESWNEFRPKIKEIQQDYGTLPRTLPDGTPKPNRILYRGQGDSCWELETTLERRSDEQFTLTRYLECATRCIYEVESFTGKQWEVAEFGALRKQLQQRETMALVNLPGYDYLVYLRHHGLPSPFLDWTESPYVAAYFAFCEPAVAKRERVAIFVYIETTTGGSPIYREGSPKIKVMGPYVKTHPRHFAQKCWYTVATEWPQGTQDHHTFIPHEKVFQTASARSNNQNDILIKLTLPASERPAALRELNDYNINDFTLFQSEDSLVRAMAMKVFDL